MSIFRRLKRKREPKGKERAVIISDGIQRTPEETYLSHGGAKARIYAARRWDVPRVPATGEPGPSAWHGRPADMEMPGRERHVKFARRLDGAPSKDKRPSGASVETSASSDAVRGTSTVLDAGLDEAGALSTSMLHAEEVEIRTESLMSDDLSPSALSDDPLPPRPRSFVERVRTHFIHAPSPRHPSSLVEPEPETATRDNRQDSSAVITRRVSSLVASIRRESADKLMERSRMVRGASYEGYVKHTGRPCKGGGWGDGLWDWDGHGSEVVLRHLDCTKGWSDIP